VRLYFGPNLSLLTTARCSGFNRRCWRQERRGRRHNCRHLGKYCTKSLYYVQSTPDHDTVGTSHPLSDAQLSLLILSGQLHSKSSMEAPANVSHRACPRAQHSRARPQMIGRASRNVRAEGREVPHHLPWLQRRMWRRSHYAFWKRRALAHPNSVPKLSFSDYDCATSERSISMLTALSGTTRDAAGRVE
jgi:hypothetical protein